MQPPRETADIILLVDDEEPVRRTFCEWLDQAGLGAHVLTAADAEEALTLANRHTIDLAILDWNLGAGSDGLQLLEDLAVFNPDIVAILVTGYAHQATPLDAMRMGVRDYLDKSQDLNRESFLTAVRRQLEHIRPAKRERRLHQSLTAFRDAVEKVLPLVRSTAALNDPVPLPEAIRSLFRFLCASTGAHDGVLLVRSYDAARDPAEVCRAYDVAGNRLEVPLVPFARSVAGAVVGLQTPHVLLHPDEAAASGTVDLQPFERGRQSLLAAPLSVAPGVLVVLELFDKPGGFTEADQRLAAAAADFGAELLRHALAEQQTQRLLFDAVEAALGASDSVAATLGGSPAERREQPPPAAVMDQLRAGLGGADAEEALRLAEAIRVLTLRHGPGTVRHCIRLVDEVRQLLDSVTGAGSVE